MRGRSILAVFRQVSVENLHFLLGALHAWSERLLGQNAEEALNHIPSRHAWRCHDAILTNKTRIGR
jgi:hypothetical protein